MFQKVDQELNEKRRRQIFLIYVKQDRADFMRQWFSNF